MGLDFSDDDLDILDRAAGGHPFLLRQLGSQAARLANRPDRVSASQVLKPGEWLEALELKRIPAETVIQSYLQQHADTLSNLWQALPPDVQQNVHLLALGRRLNPGLEPTYEALGLLAKDEHDVSRLRIGLLERWLRERRR